MKTIAISIDEPTLEALDRVVQLSAKPKLSRSQVTRRALREFLARRDREEREEHDRQVLAANRDLLARQAAALVGGQAEP